MDSITANNLIICTARMGAEMTVDDLPDVMCDNDFYVDLQVSTLGRDTQTVLAHKSLVKKSPTGSRLLDTAIVIFSYDGNIVLGVIPRICLANERSLSHLTSTRLTSYSKEFGVFPEPCLAILTDPEVHRLAHTYGKRFSRKSPIIDSIWVTRLGSVPDICLGIPPYLYDIISACYEQEYAVSLTTEVEGFSQTQSLGSSSPSLPSQSVPPIAAPVEPNSILHYLKIL